MTELEAVPGIGPVAAKRLRDAFITTAEILSVQNPMELQTRTKLGEATVEKIIRSARDVTGKFGFRSGIELEKQQALVPRLSFGIDSIDEKLFGGMAAGSIVEFYGQARCGKSYWSHHLAVRAQLPVKHGGLEGRVLWLDSESSFKTMIIRANALRWGLDPEVVLGNINVAPIAISGQIQEIFEQIQLLLAEGEYKMVVVDSLTGLFRAEFRGLSQLANRQQSINSILNSMRRLGLATDAVFVYTNQATTKISFYGGNPNAPIGGHVVSHASDYRYYCAIGLKGKRKISLKDNAGVPEFTVEVQQGWGGFYKEAKEKTATEKMIFEKLGTKPEIPDDTDDEVQEEPDK